MNKKKRLITYINGILYAKLTENITHIVSLNAGKNIPNLLLLRIQCTICLKTKIDIFVFFWNREALILKESVMKQKFSKNKLIFSNRVCF